MKIKTNELLGAALDWAVLFARNPDVANLFSVTHCLPAPFSTEWALGGPIIEEEWLDITPWPNESREDMRWHCQQHDSGGDCAQYGPTPLIAAMRCYVASKLGDDVEIPKEVTIN
jgi:Protein of unknown function (DUF2591)